MPTYLYSAASKDGQTVRGKITAPNEMELEERLEQMELVIISSRVQKEKRTSFFSKVNPKDLVMFCVHLEQLDRAGVPLLDSLADMRDSADSQKFKEIMAEVYENVKNGDQLSQALAKKKEVFNDVFVGLVAAGEKTGNLSQAFGQLAHHLKWQDEFKRQIKKAVRYPIALLLVMVGVMTLMMMFVVPQLVDFMTSQGFELPVHTRALIATSAAFENYWYIIFSIPLVSIFTIVMLYKKVHAARYKMDRFFLKLPVLGQVIQKMNLARFTHFFAITFSSGIGVLECLDTAKKVVGNLIMKDAVNDIIQFVSEGNSITRSISMTEKFPSLVVRMFRVGEESGNMDEALENINFFYDREVQDTIANLIGLIQPTLTVLMGMLMFWVISAIFGPLYQSFQNIDF